MTEESKKKNPEPSIKTISTKTFDVKAPAVREKGEVKPASSEDKQINRYLLIELSCSNVQCQPCTYPNCQRFVREKKEKPIAKGVRAVTTELKVDKHLSEILANERNEKKKKT